MADVLVGARDKARQPPPQNERQNPAAAQQGQRTPCPSSSGVPTSQDKSCQQGSPYQTAPTHTEETAKEPSPPEMMTDEAASKKEALDIERAIGKHDIMIRKLSVSFVEPLTHHNVFKFQLATDC